MHTITRGPDQTRGLAQKLSRHLRAGDIIALFGNLGAGKTVFVRGLAEGLGVKKGEVLSPTFVLVREYKKGNLPLYHFDFYRLKNLSEIYSLIQEYLSGDGIIAIEWGQKAKPFLPNDYLAVKLKFIDETTRKIEFQPIGSRYQDIIKRLKKELANTRCIS